MPLEINDNEFYIVSIDGERTAFNGEDEAIDHLRDNASAVTSGEAEIELTRVEIGEEWKLSELPWQDVALKLLDSENE